MCDIVDRKQYLVTTALIKANPLIVWTVLTDYDLLTSRFANLKSSKMIRRSESGKVFAQEAQPLPPYPCVPYVVEVLESFPTMLAWRGLSSYIKINQGYFSLQPREQDHSTFVTYAKCIEGALFVPGHVIRRQLELIMPRVLIELRDCAEKISARDSLIRTESKESRTA